MFQLIHQASNQIHTVYGVHKSGPDHAQTKFLVFDASGWRWGWASEFVPVTSAQPSATQAVRSQLRPQATRTRPTSGWRVWQRSATSAS